jgi:DNA polymerase III alpha subunit
MLLSKISFILFLLPVFLLASPSKVKLSEVIKNPDKYDNRIISVEGYIQNIKQKISQRGNKYTTFSISDNEGNSLKVFLWGWEGIEEQNIEEGDKVEVEGKFQKIRYVGKYKFYNEIEAEKIKRSKNAKEK